MFKWYFCQTLTRQCTDFSKKKCNMLINRDLYFVTYNTYVFHTCKHILNLCLDINTYVFYTCKHILNVCLNIWIFCQKNVILLIWLCSHTFSNEVSNFNSMNNIFSIQGTFDRKKSWIEPINPLVKSKNVIFNCVKIAILLTRFYPKFSKDYLRDFLMRKSLL